MNHQPTSSKQQNLRVRNVLYIIFMSVCTASASGELSLPKPLPLVGSRGVIFGRHGAMVSLILSSLDVESWCSRGL